MEWRRFRLGLFVAAILLTLPVPVRANAGPAMSGGHASGEPFGIVDISIEWETLTIDLRPLAYGHLADVVAIYHLHNRGPTRKLDLVFASGSPSVANFSVWLGDKPIANAHAENIKLPPSWQTPKHTPGLSDPNGLAPLGYYPGSATPVAFTVIVPPGPHEMKVSYTAELVKNREGYPTVYHQFVYVLAPARAWSGFGGMDVTVYVPAGWRAACTPGLAREGDILKGRFADVPTDAIAVTIQAPEGWAYWLLAYSSVGLLCFSGVGGAVMCWKGGQSTSRGPVATTDTKSHQSSKSFAWGLVWGLVILCTGCFATLGPEQLLPSGQASHYGYGEALQMFGVFFLSAAAVLVGFFIAQSGAADMHRSELVREETKETKRDASIFIDGRQSNEPRQ